MITFLSIIFKETSTIRSSLSLIDLPYLQKSIDHNSTKRSQRPLTTHLYPTGPEMLLRFIVPIMVFGAAVSGAPECTNVRCTKDELCRQCIVKPGTRFGGITLTCLDNNKGEREPDYKWLKNEYNDCKLMSACISASKHKIKFNIFRTQHLQTDRP